MDEVTIVISGNTYTDIPDGFHSGSFVTDRGDKHIFYRKKLNASLILDGEAYNNMLDLLLANDCTDQTITITRSSGTWEGLFSIADGEFDLAICTFTFTPRPNDYYDEFLQQADEKYNIMTLADKESVNPGGAYDSYDNCRRFITIIENLVGELDSSITFQSDFFNNATNYVTLLENRYRYLFIAQKSDIVDPDATEEVRYAYLSFSELMEIVRIMFNVYWDITEAGVFRLEHYSYWLSDDVHDVSTDELSLGKASITFQRENKWRSDRIKLLEQGTPDFSDTIQLGYVGCTKLEDNERVRAVPIMTDLPHFLETNADIGPEGYVLFACTSSTGNGVYATAGLLTGSNQVNGDLAPAKLMQQLYRHNAPAESGNILFEEYTMFNTAPDKTQSLAIKQCAPFDVYSKIKTVVYDKIVIYGRIISIEENLRSGVGVVQIGYGYNDKPQPTPDPESKTITIDVDDVSPYTLNAAFSELSGSGLSLTVAWEVKQAGTLIESGTDTWSVATNVWTDTFTPTWTTPFDPSYCIELSITPSDGTWTVIIQIPALLQC